jgi:hypothetical protein
MEEMLLVPLIVVYYGCMSYCEDPGQIFGHGGVSHGDNGHLGYSVDGHFGGVFSHHNGVGTHAGDTGKNGILFTNDVVHHGDGGIFISKGGASAHGDGAIDAMSIDDIHHKMNDAEEDAHNASIAGKEAERRAELLRASIARERAAQKQEEIENLKVLDDEAAKKEHERPEVLGKMTVPVVNFTEESIPLFHHVRELLARIKAIQETEQKNIQAQELITRLDDITDQLKLQDVALENPSVYREFMRAGKVGEMMFHVPVSDQGGMFYVSSYGAGGHDSHTLPMKEHQYGDGHSHWVDHGDHTTGVLEMQEKMLSSALGGLPVTHL